MPECHEGAPSTPRRRVLFRSLGIDVVDFRCHACVEPLGAEEPNPTHSIVFVRRGLFMRTDGARTIVADANQILFFNEGQPYRYAHPLPGGDVCTILTLDDDCVRIAMERLGHVRAAEGPYPFPVGNALLSRRASRLHYELLAILHGGPTVPELVVQDTLVELVDNTITALHHAQAASPGDGRRTRERRRDMVEAVKVIVNRSIRDLPSLGTLAAIVQCSPFHLSRSFRIETGLSLRQYIRRLRTTLAADRLLQGEADLTSLALDLGFCDHSHFTKAFRQEWGTPPSRLRLAKPLRPELGPG